MNAYLPHDAYVTGLMVPQFGLRGPAGVPRGRSAGSVLSQQVDRSADGGVGAAAARHAGVELRVQGLEAELKAGREPEEHRAAIGQDVFPERRRARREGGEVVGAVLGEQAGLD